MAKVEEYYIHKIDDKTCRMQKAVNGDLILTSSYIVGDHECQCYQALRPARCRHMDIRKAWILRKISPKSAIYNMKEDRFYLIEASE
jgi:hypothetical protein